MQDSSLHSVVNTQIFNGHITEEIIYQEFVKMGMQDFVANDLSKRYYRNELTYKDIEYLETTFNLKLEKVETLLQAEIKSVESSLQAEIQRVETNLKSDIRDLDNKIDNVENNLNTKIDTKFNDLDNKIDNVRNEVSLVRKDMEINRVELDNKLDKTASEFKSTSRLHNWMFGTLITLNIGIFLTLISIVYSLLNK